MSLNNTCEDMNEDSGRKGTEDVSPKIYARKSTRLSIAFRKDAPTSNGLQSDNLLFSSPLPSQERDIRSSGSTSNKDSQDHQDERTISLADYEKALQAEIEEWSLTRRSRSEKYHQLHNQLKSQAFDTITMESCADFLSNEDKKFMSERPNYVQIANNARDMKEEVIIALGIKKSKLLGAKAKVANFTKKLEDLDREAANLD